jgi:ankyrin repeat protein
LHCYTGRDGVKKELERGADCNAGRDLGLYTPLHVAAAAVSTGLLAETEG